MDFLTWGRSPWDQSILTHVSWDLLWVSLFAGVAFLIAHAGYMVLSAHRKRHAAETDAMEAARADLPAWREPGDPRNAITLDVLLRMSSGLAWREDYVDAGKSDVIEMLFGRGKDDVAAFAAEARLAHPPDTVWCYSSGTSNLVSSVAGRALGGGEALVREYLRRELFLVAICLNYAVRLSRAGTQLKNLAQELALLNARVDSLARRPSRTPSAEAGS